MTPIEHAGKEYPRESCGLIVNGEYVPCKNVADNPEEMFAIAPREWQECDAIVHSHPQGQPFLSGADRQMQSQSGKDWWLVVGGEIKKFRYAPLLRGRKFEYGKYDCCTLIRDAYMLACIELIDAPRTTMKADIDNENIINQLKASGMRRVEKIQAGDIVLTSWQGKASHASVYIGDDTLVHHPAGQLSHISPWSGFYEQNQHSIWRHPQWQQSFCTAIWNDLENRII